jgi:hypothetical protein
MRDAIERHYLNWLPTDVRFDYKKVQKVQVEKRADCSILWTCSMLESTAVSIYVTLDDAQLRLKDGGHVGEDFEIVGGVGGLGTGRISV